MRILLAAVVAALAFAPEPCNAQSLIRDVHMANDNDYFNFWIESGLRPDRDYTQGIRVSWDTDSVWRRARKLVCRERLACGRTLEFGQEMYTPDIDSRDPVPGERPYMGWLYGRADVRGGNNNRLETYGLTIGITGPLSLARQVQEHYHRLDITKRQPLGWSHQMQTEIAFAARAGRKWRFAQGKVADIVPSLDLAAGTFRTAASVTARTRIGAGLIHPWMDPGPGKHPHIYLLAGAGATAVAHDLSLHGSTFRRSERVTKEALVPEWERGIGLGMGRLGIEYRALTVGREFRTGPRKHTYSTIAVSWASLR